MSDPREVLKEAGYVTVGLGLLAFQRAQVHRREIERRLEQAGQLERVNSLVEDVRGLLNPANWR